MNRLLRYGIVVVCGLVSSFSVSEAATHKKSEPYVVVKQQVYPFSLKDVRLTPGIFQKAMELDKKWLLDLEADRFLCGFREEAGLKPKAPRYGGWETSGASGHTFGHYLSACAMMYAATGDEELLKKLDYIIGELDSCQQTVGTGFLAGFPRSKALFEEIARGDIRSNGFDLNEGWVPVYTIHKLFAGLIDVYRYTGDQRCYRILIRLSDWWVKIFKGLNDEQVAKILHCEHGGINEAMADVYALTGDRKYLELANRLNDRVLMDPLARREDKLSGKHANTQVPKVVGAIRQFELGCDSSYYTIADFFWNTVVHHHTYVIGGNSEAEHFGMPGKLCDRVTEKTCETCNTYNMLKLTKHLFQLQPTVEKADYYERALYNQILASQNPDDGMVCYFAPLASGSRKTYSSPYDAFWCCVGTGFENHARYGEFIYFTNDQDDLFVNLFIPSELNWKERGIRVTQRTSFPESDSIVYRFDMKKRQKFTLHLRYPSWAQAGYTLAVNGQPVGEETEPGQYLTISRKWAPGDEVTYVLKQTVRSEGILGDSTVRAYLNGPVVLAAPLADEQAVPVIVSERLTDAGHIVKRVGDGLHFKTTCAEPENVGLIPYYRIGGRRMMVFFNHFKPEEWKIRQADLAKRQDRERWLKEQTVSQFSPGEMQPERDHQLKGEKTQPGEFNGHKFREAKEGGWFSFEMEVLPDRPMNLLCKYWGGIVYWHMFDILIDNVLVAQENVHNWGDQFVERNYKIPLELTKGKSKVTVTLKAADEKNTAGPLFDCRIMK